MGASAIAVVGLFALLPAAAAGGAMALPVLLCLAGLISLRPALLRQAIENRPIALALLIAFLLWAVVTSLWSPHAGGIQAMKLAALAPLGLVFAAAAGAAPARRLTRAGGIAAFLVLAVLLAIEAVWGMPLNRAANPGADPRDLIQNVDRGATVLLAITWTSAAALLAQSRRVLALVVLAASALLALPFGLWANLIATGAGLAAFLLAFAAPRLAILAVSAGLAIWTLAAPFATPLLLSSQRLVDALPESWAQRAGIWNYVCARIPEQLWLGHGLDASRAVTDRILVRGVDLRGVPLHPHSGALQIWFETGAIGAALAAAALVAGGWAMARAFKDNRPAAAAAAATLASLGIVANVSFGLWQEWWNTTLFVAAALVGALSTRR